MPDYNYSIFIKCFLDLQQHVETLTCATQFTHEVHLNIITEDAFNKSRLDVHFEVPRGAALGILCGVGGGWSL